MKRQSGQPTTPTEFVNYARDVVDRAERPFPPQDRMQTISNVLTLLLPLLGWQETSTEAAQLRQLLVDNPQINSMFTLRMHLRDPLTNTELAGIAGRLDAEAWHHRTDWQKTLGVGPDAKLFDETVDLRPGACPPR